ncbi:unnamed protein product [Echinostoma caproni]|uniref:Uncharacterized protein n=1 Tax=Echinostoma caproni TaxID=27848 RepID=A0A3P8L2F2_9TREM|nr:unnamed protein product [Echinostoma caproni]
MSEAEQKDSDADELRKEKPENLPPNLARNVRELTERIAHMRTRIQRRTCWLRDVEDLIILFRQEAQDTERWMTSINFKLISPTGQQGGALDTTPRTLTGALPSSGMEAVTKFTSHEVLLKEIGAEGKKHITRVHDLAHELVHSALNDNATGLDGSRCPQLGTCDVTGCDLREVPFNPQTIATLHYLVQPNARPLGLIALDSVQRAHELELNHANLHATAMAIQSRVEEQRSRWKAYVRLLHSIALALAMDLPQWWSKQYGDQPRSGTAGAAAASAPVNSCPFQLRADLNRSDYSLPYLSGQLEHLALTATDQTPAPKANSLAEVDQLLESNTAMETQLNAYRKELAKYSRNETGRLVGFDEQPIDVRGSMGSPTHMEQMPVDQLYQRVNAAIERESRKVSGLL